MKNDVDKYIEEFPPITQKQLNKLRAIIREAAPAQTKRV